MIAVIGLDPVRPVLAEMAPLLRRVHALDPEALARVRVAADRVALLVRLPFGVLASRTLAADLPPHPQPQPQPQPDRTVAVAALLAWLDGERCEPPEPRDADWRGAAPPTRGWQRVDTVPEQVLRDLVRSGALALKDAAAREGAPGRQPRTAAADALLDTVVLTADGAGRRAQVTLRSISALIRMGFLPRGSQAAVDVAGGWVRVAAKYGSVFAEAPGASLGALRPT